MKRKIYGTIFDKNIINFTIEVENRVLARSKSPCITKYPLYTLNDLMTLHGVCHLNT